MHTACQLDARLFAISRNGRPATREDLLPGWHSLDRLGVVVNAPFGAVGASHLIQLAITAFYDALPGRQSSHPGGVGPRALYPEIYLFHVGGRHGDHSAYDFWPSRKEVFLEADPRLVLDAINDRGITRLAVAEGPRIAVEHELTEPAAAFERVVTACAYSPTGQVSTPTWSISGLDEQTEAKARLVLDPALRVTAAARIEPPSNPDLHARSWMSRTSERCSEASGGLHRARHRRNLVRNARGLATETYQEISIAEALQMLA